MRLRKRKFRPGILLHGKKIWISELLSIIITAILLVSFATLSLSILNNERIQHKRTNEIASLKRENIVLKYTLEQTMEQMEIAQLLCSFAGNKIDPHTILQLTNLVHSSSKQFGYDPMLLLAVIHVESVFNPKALGRYRTGDLSGAMGLMQLKFETAREMAKKLDMKLSSESDLLKPETNVVIGVAYLTHLINRFKSFKLGLLAYNQGPQTIRNTLSKNEPLSVNYYKKVLNSYYKLQQLANRSGDLPNRQSHCW